MNWTRKANKAASVLIVFLLLTLRSISQDSTASKDSCSCIPNQQLRAAIKDIEQGKIDKEKLKVKDEQINILQERVSLKNEIIDLMKENKATANLLYAKTSNEAELERKRANTEADKSKKFERKWRFAKLGGWVKGGIGVGIGFAGAMILF